MYSFCLPFCIQTYSVAVNTPHIARVLLCLALAGQETGIYHVRVSICRVSAGAVYSGQHASVFPHISDFPWNPKHSSFWREECLGFHGKSLMRSEEHTSELQSHLNLVCRLLLEKKNKMK